MSSFLDRNGDGKVNFSDLKGKQTVNNQPLAHRNPLDRNGDGKVDFKDLTNQPAMAQQGLVGQQPLLANNAGMVGGARLNPLDRNGDGRVDLNDLRGNSASGFAHNPLDKNFDGKVDYKDFAGQPALAPGMMQQTTMSTTQTMLPAQTLQGQRLSRGYETEILNQGAYIQNTKMIEKDVVIQEEIQPIIYREREQLDVKQITQMLHETQIQPTIIQQRELPAETREAVVERGAAIMPNTVLPTQEFSAVSRTQVVHAPIVEEIIKKTVIEEVQPVLERDIIQATVIQNTQPIYEKIIEAPTVTRSIVQTRELGTFEAGQTGFASRRLSQNYNGTVLPNQFQSTTNQRLSGNFNDNLLLQQQNQMYAQGLQGQRLSGTYVDPLMLQQQSNQYQLAGPAVMQNRRLSQNFNLSNPASLAGINNSGLGLASSTGISQSSYNQSQLYGNGGMQRNMFVDQPLNLNNGLVNNGLNNGGLLNNGLNNGGWRNVNNNGWMGNNNGLMEKELQNQRFGNMQTQNAMPSSLGRI